MNDLLCGRAPNICIEFMFLDEKWVKIFGTILEKCTRKKKSLHVVNFAKKRTINLLLLLLYFPLKKGEWSQVQFESTFDYTVKLGNKELFGHPKIVP